MKTQCNEFMLAEDDDVCYELAPTCATEFWCTPTPFQIHFAPHSFRERPLEPFLAPIQTPSAPDNPLTWKSRSRRHLGTSRGRLATARGDEEAGALTGLDALDTAGNCRRRLGLIRGGEAAMESGGGGLATDMRTPQLARKHTVEEDSWTSVELQELDHAVRS